MDVSFTNRSSCENISASGTEKPHWTFLPIFLSILTPLAVILNCAVLVPLVINQRSQPAFNIYLINLTISNLAYSVTILPFDIVSSVHINWPLGYGACLLFQYSIWAIHGCIIHSHILLTLNRLWAVFLPVHYHRAQVKHFRVAVVVCLCMWVYVNLVAVPGLTITKIVFERSPCFLDIPSHPRYWQVAQGLLYDSTLAFLALAIPVVWYKRRHRRRNRVVSAMNAPHPTHSRTVQSFQQSTQQVSKETQAQMERRVVNERSYFQVWLVLTSVTVLCWAPLIVFYATAVFSGTVLQELMEAGTALYSLTPLIDPILITIIMPTMRIGPLQ
ncbi:hypothetical protein RvY_15073 [Ramazzottius varieornatus]|uniref:G-protein coupled receptors family 1 profile domain-containing protein n=1 Tax=Ramazzottius varieornatus TaxID=947166 RepID=A0A1D1VV01_RAMVA|nr:hypothetical protein RvY_15073 [Ramazzottius varieornatus]